MSTDTSVSSNDSHSTQTRVRRSMVWEYFEQNLVEADDGFKAVCKYCQIHLSTKSGTSSLRTSDGCWPCGRVGVTSRSESVSLELFFNGWNPWIKHWFG